MPDYESFDEWKKAASRRRYSGEPLSENNMKSIWNSENRKELTMMIPRIKKETGTKVNKFIGIFPIPESLLIINTSILKSGGLIRVF